MFLPGALVVWAVDDAGNGRLVLLVTAVTTVAMVASIVRFERRYVAAQPGSAS